MEQGNSLWLGKDCQLLSTAISQSGEWLQLCHIPGTEQLGMIILSLNDLPQPQSVVELTVPGGRPVTPKTNELPSHLVLVNTHPLEFQRVEPGTGRGRPGLFGGEKLKYLN